MASISLFALTTDNIKISVEARFEDEVLIIDGYDIGKTVEEYWGDSDYEYTTTIPDDSVKQLYILLNIESGNKQALLNELAKRYNSNTCYSDIQKLLDDNKIAYKGFSWT